MRGGDEEYDVEVESELMDLVELKEGVGADVERWKGINCFRIKRGRPVSVITSQFQK